jgi:hypothetical protein
MHLTIDCRLCVIPDGDQPDGVKGRMSSGQSQAEAAEGQGEIFDGEDREMHLRRLSKLFFWLTFIIVDDKCSSVEHFEQLTLPGTQPTAHFDQ